MRLLRVKEAAELLGVKNASIRELDRRGLLHAVRDWSGHRRFKDSDVLELRETLLQGEIKGSDTRKPSKKRGRVSKRNR